MQKSKSFDKKSQFYFIFLKGMKNLKNRMARIPKSQKKYVKE